MWKLKVSSKGNDERITSSNNNVGRQFWEFDSNLGTSEEELLL